MSASPGPPRWPARYRQLADVMRLLRLDRRIGIYLLLWPTLWALWLASGGTPSSELLVIFVLGTIVMRSAGCAANDFLDRDIDPHVARTRDRPLASRRISPYTAVVVVMCLMLLALWLALKLNPYTLKLAVVGAVLTLSYPLMKRFFPLPQLYLGLGFGWGVPMAFAAQLGFVPREGWTLFLGTVLWAAVYDTFYAMVDRNDDLRIGVRSSAISFGDQDLAVIAGMQAMVLLALWLVGQSLGRGSRFHTALLIGTLLFAWQLWTARKRDRAGCFAAFNQNHYFGLVILAGLVWDYAA